MAAVFAAEDPIALGDLGPVADRPVSVGEIHRLLSG
jgi:hypothetical protein